VLDGEQVAIIALGPEVHRALEAAEMARKSTGRTPAVFNARFLKPFDEVLLQQAGEYAHVLTVEEGCIKGGLFGEVAEGFARRGIKTDLRGLGAPDEFIAQATQKSQRAACRLDAEGIFKEIMECFKMGGTQD
jgi:Deoxyxylulose-5-phosphate synthase